MKRKFLEKIVKKYDIKAQVLSNIYDNEIDVDYIVSRAFKKFEKIIQVSREIVKKPHKLIVLKGANAEEEINKAFIKVKYPYKLEKSMTDKNSKIIIIDFN